MNTDGSGQTRLTANDTNDESPRWSPDNSRILFQSDRDNPFCQVADIYAMNADGSGQTRLTTDVNDDSAPVWSPDGSKVALQSLRNGVNYQVYVMNADGSGQVNLSNGSSNDGQPSWSPDGTKIAFSSDRDDPARPSIYVMNANGSNQTRLTFTSTPFRDEQPVWSPDGSKLAFVSTRDSIIDTWQETDDEGGILTRTAVRTNKEVYLMNADGTSQVRLTNTLEHDDSPGWSADGAQIVFRSERERECCDPVPQVWIMNPDGSNQMNLSNNEFGDYGPGWQQAAGNVPPTVSITSPAGGATFTAPANITVTASASDSGGAISKVDFYQGTALLGTDTTAPYSFDWSNVPAGIYSLTAKATDNGGATTTSTAVSITVNAVATVSYDSTTNRITTAGVIYDGAGQITADANFRGLKYQYNPEGRMTSSANLDDSNPSTSVYDGLGQRVQTTQAGVTKSYFYNSNGSVVAEYEANGGTGYGVLKRLNIYGGRLLAVDEVQSDGTKLTSYRMADRQGSTRVLMDAAGTVTSRHDYLPFGEELGAGSGAPGSPTGMRTAAQGYSAADNVRERYAQTRLDDATGLDHTLWRKLEPRSGRWTTPDPYGHSLKVENPQSFNRYPYVNNDPMNFVDPSGLNVAFMECRMVLDVGSDGSFAGFGRYAQHYVCSTEGGDGSAGPRSGGGGSGPRNRTPNVDDLRDRIADMVSKPDCANFIERLISGSATSNNPAVGTNALDLFNEIASLRQRGVVYGDSIARAYPGRTGATISGSIDTGTAQIELPTPAPFPVGLSQQGAAQYRNDQARIEAQAALHETIHLAGKFGFDDYRLANTVARMRGVEEGKFGDVWAASDYWNKALAEACFSFP